LLDQHRLRLGKYTGRRGSYACAGRRFRAPKQSPPGAAQPGYQPGLSGKAAALVIYSHDQLASVFSDSISLRIGSANDGITAGAGDRRVPLTFSQISRDPRMARASANGMM
jgi:hypothetical protein